MFIGHTIQLVAKDPAVWLRTCVSKREASYNVDRKVLGLPLMATSCKVITLAGERSSEQCPCYWHMPLESTRPMSSL